ncbi:Aldose 1-epimerase precursor [Falsiruegeria litorea R37]|uniref:Aldose 1-epimerase n=1 Tax=Falsiruegeria litorea R37 TaxID=1200284 RepID=A0A1Y5T1R4_9RHOB|nr:aldose epimerase family protein [Falsiruegeria litorea]SLN53464.1 Aldose 1-epimerase precursor [Falsiruegeria litorea R37]
MEQIRRHVLSDGEVSVAVLSLGCITQDWQVPMAGKRMPVVLGYRDPAAYLYNPCYLGAIVGRVANRISGAVFELDGVRYPLDANEPPHHLHGGAYGLHSRNWTLEADGARAVQLRLTSADGEGGYPGRLDLCVTITLEGHRLTYEIEARSNRPTPVNLAQHSYYALGDASVHIPAQVYTPTDDRMIPTAARDPIAGHSFDFKTTKPVSLADPDGAGLDMNFILDGTRIEARGSGLQMVMETDQPCLQLYTAQHLVQVAEPLKGQTHKPRSALCLEPQGYPNAVNTPGFPLSLATPEEPYCQRLSVSIREDTT